MGKGLPAVIDLGNGGGGGGGSSTGAGSGSAASAEAGVEDLREDWGVETLGFPDLLLAACSLRAAARGGSFLFFSIASAKRSGFREECNAPS